MSSPSGPPRRRLPGLVGAVCAVAGSARRSRAGSLRAGTEQARLVAALGACVSDLEALRSSGLPDVLTDAAIEGVVAARCARDVAVRVARAVDAFDDVLERARALGAGSAPPTPAAAAALARAYDRRARLLAVLHDGLASVQDVHTVLLEVSAAVELHRAGSAGDLADVGRRLEVLRRAVLTLDATAARALPSAG